MYSFKNDYSEGAHPKVLEALIKYNLTQEEGYGVDSHSLNAIKRINNLIGHEKSDVHLISGGTQTNLIAISAFLRPYEACIAPNTGHIATHETGAIEATGHKILTLEAEEGKLTPELIDPTLTEHHFEHMVKPRLVYISNPTELGTVYTKVELEALYSFCQANDLLLYCDGARLGAALTVKEAELTMSVLAANTDAFFIGGTKIGALLGEALVINNDALKSDMRYMIKQRGALLAKGRVLGIQFEALLENNLYLELADHANTMAKLLTDQLLALGCPFFIDSPTNQRFPIMENRVIDQLQENFSFYVWAKVDQDRSALRLVTSWATEEETIHEFIDAYKQAADKIK